METIGLIMLIGGALLLLAGLFFFKENKNKRVSQ